MEVIKPNIKVDLKIDTQEERQTIVHCKINVPNDDLLLRIWKSTYLRDNASAYKAEIVTAYNISFHPIWTVAQPNHVFTLIFKGLNKSCNTFDLIEDIPQSGGFYVPNIQRNNSDVYTILV